MRITKYDRKKLNVRAYTMNYQILKDFAESGMDCAKVEDYPQATPYICKSSLQHSIATYRFANMRAIVRNKEVYLIRD